ncbi:uncharacterized protein LOC118748136 [Rhagoletis pomonella]|uniref:uncharacterized protein LOC118748136 n=1 Tax=Rhagoletis pomonella TaxID=28610 RepID=UPI001782EB91|nr:uncharacterized protein LOC118748136 [Rhagoletis pomonella]
MSKTTNRKQVEILISLMETKPDIARDFHKGNRKEVSRFWRNPEVYQTPQTHPKKNTTEWKKVWTDKKNMCLKRRRKISSSKGTGGGPNTQQKLSSNEETIYKLIGMKESVEGILGVYFWK